MTTTSSTDNIKAIGGLFPLHKHPVSCNCWNHRRGPVLHVVKSSMESTLHCDHRIGARELKDTEHFLLRCCHSETRVANAVSGRSDWVGWRGGGTTEHSTGNYSKRWTTLFVMACDSFRGVACVLWNEASKLVHSLWKTRYIVSNYRMINEWLERMCNEAAVT
jgi:hypothetical protein